MLHDGRSLNLHTRTIEKINMIYMTLLNVMSHTYAVFFNGKKRREPGSQNTCQKMLPYVHYDKTEYTLLYELDIMSDYGV